MLCIPIVFIPLLSFVNQKVWAILLFIVWLLFLVTSSILEPILTQFASISGTFERYIEVYTDDSTMSFGFGYLLRLLPFFYLLYGLFTNQFIKVDIPILLIWSLSILLTPFGTIIPMFGRLLFYFELAGFVVFPNLFSNCRLTPIRLLLVMSILLLAAYTLSVSFYNPESVYFDPYLEFHTIFDVI